ncbi:zinc finger CCCH domain-containing protein [Musa troglodytarum]|uniref:Zinc finger CCCH domain-containing protein n=1 Tax=Musa troglodytarum TaxID=320322 RepID=A0A9E7KZZ2_9LILI|nr:zinc finger CCCH domain-containing protein [Musa troglodytarum]
MMPDTRHNAVSSSSNALPHKLEEAMWQLKIEDGQEAADGQLNPYPDRPGEPDCLHYLRTGKCGFGSKCKYNHPALGVQVRAMGCNRTLNLVGNSHREMANLIVSSSVAFSHLCVDYDDGVLVQIQLEKGELEAFFLKTGSCKYGITCKYHHPRDKHEIHMVQLNVLGLPIRKDEKPCAYYMRTGSCKYGVTCKFNHPQPASRGTSFPVTGSSVYDYAGYMAPTSGPHVIGGISQWHLSRIPYLSNPTTQGFPAYVPLGLPPSQGTIPVPQGWISYMGNTNHMSSTDMPAPGLTAKHQEQPGPGVPLSLPDRPDQPECQYYMKTGNCKYGNSCKYHHPKERNQPATATIGPLGLPLRPGQPVCTFYAAYGSCNYGTACKFDHPLAGYYGYSLPPFTYPGQPALFPNQRSLQVIWTSAGNSSSKSSNLPDQLAISEKGGAQQNPQTHEHGNPTTNTLNNESHPEST